MFKKILVPLDLQDMKGSVKTLQALVDYAGGKAEIRLMSVLAGYQMPMVASYFPKDMKVKALEAMEKELQELGAKELGGLEFKVEVCEGSAHKAIVERAKKMKADLILISAQKHGAVEKMMLGSVTAKVAERSPCSVLLIKE